ncbi:hypothetical protein [Streptomyces sp. NRRL F-5123]|uniref:hypothetical protein n=1 Tax=Streptomyces sp. NRRL F-5123 TaxID=1463856 RepID=UPI0004E20397|nr:hypothetical protein [Streptomyces sp. NRRL F-5123]
MNQRWEELKRTYPKLFENEREAKLAAWAQFKLADLRDLLMSEAREKDMLREEIQRLTGGPS